MKVNTTSIPRDPNKTNFTTGDYQLAYINTLDALDLLHGNRAVPLTPELWQAAYNLYAFKLVSGDIDDGPAIHPNELYGNVSIKLEFGAATNAALALLVYSETPSLLEITNLNTVLLS